jgi:hypothetical protein
MEPLAMSMLPRNAVRDSRHLHGISTLLQISMILCITRRPAIAGPEPQFIQNLNMTGFVQSTSGTLLDSEAIEYNQSKNSLAVERNLFQLDINDDLTERDSAFMRIWGVYEPSYPYETGCLNQLPCAGPLQFRLLQSVRHPRSVAEASAGSAAVAGRTPDRDLG